MPYWNKKIIDNTQTRVFLTQYHLYQLTVERPIKQTNNVNESKNSHRHRTKNKRHKMNVTDEQYQMS